MHAFFFSSTEDESIQITIFTNSPEKAFRLVRITFERNQYKGEPIRI